jgi:hypothetical protein
VARLSGQKEPDAMDPAALSTTDLLAAAAEAAQATPVDQSRLWPFIHALHDRGTREVFDAAAAWCRAPEATLRSLGADVLSSLGIEDSWPFAKESDAVLMPLLDDPEPDVIAAAVNAIEQLDIGDNLAIARLHTHPAREVRAVVSHCLAAFSDPDTSDALIALSRDADTEVRRNAVNGLAARPHLDSEAIRLALIARVCDPDRETAEEAIFGLAIRRDARGDAMLRAALQDPDAGEIIHMAALYRDPRRRRARALEGAKTQ